MPKKGTKVSKQTDFEHGANVAQSEPDVNPTTNTEKKMAILGTVKLDQTQEYKVPRRILDGIIGKPEVNETKNGNYVSIVVPIEYTDEKTGKTKEFNARMLAKPAWFEAEYQVLDPLEQEKGTPEYSDAWGYQMTFQKLIRPLFAFTETDPIGDFDALEGKRIVVKTQPDRQDGSKEVVQNFLKPR